MVFDRARTYLMLSLVVGAAQLAGCVGEEQSAESATLADREEEDLLAAERGFYCTGEPDAATSCPMKGEGYRSEVSESSESSAACPGPDWYFHPNNGSHGGWIEAWRLCNEGGQNFRICTGGYGPVRYWNPSACGGSVHDYYPQGWSGWAQTGGGCC
jgi:hypothetical protein